MNKDFKTLAIIAFIAATATAAVWESDDISIYDNESNLLSVRCLKDY